MSDTGWWIWVTLLGLGATTVISRGFFYLSSKPWPLPGWAQRGLQYAPIAALGAVVMPELVLSGGRFSLTLADARLWAGLVAAAFVLWRRHTSYALPGAILSGMAVYLPLRLSLGW